MKRLLSFLLMLSMIATISSCGNDNSSGGGSSSSTQGNVTPVESYGNWYGDDPNDPANVANYNRMRSYYEGLSLSANLYQNMELYQVGQVFGGENLNDVNYDANIDFSFCGQILFWEVGDCQPYSNSYGNQFQSLIEGGPYRVVTSWDGQQVTSNLANGYNDYGLNFVQDTFDRNNKLYREMLNLDGISVDKVVITKAEINVRRTDANGSDAQSETLNADYVEYFYTDKTVKGFVISHQLPLMANPVAVTYRPDYYQYGSYPELDGKLIRSGSYTINSVRVDIHVLTNSFGTGTYEFKAQKVDTIFL